MFLNKIIIFLIFNILIVKTICEDDLNDSELLFNPSPDESDGSFKELFKSNYDDFTINDDIQDEYIVPEITESYLLLNNNDNDTETSSINEKLEQKNVSYSTTVPSLINEYFLEHLNDSRIVNKTNDNLNDNEHQNKIYTEENSDTLMDILNETSLILTASESSSAHEMKHNILYTDELDENVDLKMKNNSLNDEIDGNENDENDKENNLKRIIDEPEMLIATTTVLPLLITRQSKQSKQTIAAQMKKTKKILLPHERLRNYIEDIYLRTPVAVIVDPIINSLDQTKQLWDNALKSTNTPLDIILLGLNATGVSVTFHFQNTRTFLAGLNSLKEQQLPGNPFVGILKAYELIPYDSAVFISAASLPINSELAHHAGIALLKKRIRLYLIWFGDKSFNENEAEDITGGILGKIANRSGGEIILMGQNPDQQQSAQNMITLISNNYRGTQEIELPVPVDTTMSNLQIKIDSEPKLATLETSSGEIDLKKVMKLTSKKFLGLYKKYYEINVQLDNNSVENYFKLKIIPENLNQNYCLSVDLLDEDEINQFKKDFTEIVNSRNGNEINKFQKLRYPSDELKNLTEIINLNETKAAQQNGLIKGITKIEMGVQSKLLVAPGTQSQLYFEITNLRDEPIFHTIQVVDDQRYLIGLSRPSIFLLPGIKDTVVLTVRVSPQATQGIIDKITFTCQGQGQTSITVNLKVLQGLEAQDTRAPELTWRYGARCESYYYQPEHCSSRYWTLDITAQDFETGILAIKSNPEGVISRVPYTIGTNEIVRATYTASCCQPKVTITAHDLTGNQRSQAVDVRDIYLTEASIAAIVLGVILLIILIAALIACIVLCCKRRQSASRDLPSYRSHPERR